MRDLLLIPNLLTLARIVLLAPGIYFLETGKIALATACITILFVTDFLDGAIARKYQMESYLGSILDPVADKIVVLAFFSYYFFRGELVLFYYLLIVLRDIAQLLSIPILLLWKKIEFKVKPSRIAKWGTAFNFILLGALSTKFFLPLAQYETLYRFFAFPLLLLSSLVEVYILVTYLPRFVAIYRGNHDTFE
ncbi:MAG: CDP-alcohol phosphatidyltransferase family protein [Spirochaetota bacterium]